MNSQPLNRLTCDEVQELLIKIQFEKISLQDQKALERHLKKCTTCHQFAESLKFLPKIFGIFDENQKASEQVKNNVLAGIHRQKKKTGTNQSKILDQVIEFFNYRIPLYQVGVAVMIIIILNFSLVKFNVFKKKENLLPVEKHREKQLPVKQENVSKAVLHLKIVSNKGGNTIKEDSTYAQFVRPIL